MDNNDYDNLTGKDFEFLIVGDIDVFENWDTIMIPVSYDTQKIQRDNWVYYKIDNDEFSYSVEPPGIQMMFNNEISYKKAKSIADEVLLNIKETGQEAELVFINKNSIYKF